MSWFEREKMAKLAVEIASEKANWLDDVIGGLLINGVMANEIDVQEHPSKTVVAVRGVPRYSWEHKLTIGGRQD